MSPEFIETFDSYGIKGIDVNKSGEQYALCPQCSHRREAKHQNIKCLGVNAEKGIWHCNHCEWSGSLKKAYADKKFTWTPIQSKAQPPSDNIIAYFESRGISRKIIERNHITKDKLFMPEVKAETGVVCFNYYIGDDLVNIKYRDTVKHFMQVKGGAKVFYKLNDIVGVDNCIITEGEFDALSFEEAGYRNSISVPDGAPNPDAKNLTTKFSYIDNCWNYFNDEETKLPVIKKIYLATDADAPGLRLREELARRFGKSRCWIVKFPQGYKDANEVLMGNKEKNLMALGTEALNYAVENAEPYPIEGIHYANDRKQELYDLYELGYPNGTKTGWYNFDDHIRFYDSLLTVVTGVPSHGKSVFLDNLMIKLIIKGGWKFGIFSPENSRQEIHLHRLAEIITGRPMLPGYNGQMTIDELDQAREFCNKNIFWINPANEDFKLQNILEAAEHLVLKHGIKALIIDPWNSIEHEYGKDTETEYTKKILNKLTYFERNHGLHLFLVVHPAKMKRRGKDGTGMKYEVPTLYDCSGSANFYNKAEMGMCVYREFSEDCNKTLYTAVHIQKVKHNYMGKLGYVKFEYDSSCQRFYEKDINRNENNLLDNKYQSHYTDDNEDDAPF